MALTRLKNIITSRTGRIIYVNPDDFDASDAYDNRGNSALRPFKTLQRAFLEVARFSYRVGLSNDEFDAFSIYLYPSEYVLDNRPGSTLYGDITPFDENTNFDLTSPNNILYKFNSVNGGIICPRGVSVVGSDLRRTKIIPKYVPYPTLQASLGITSANEPTTSAIFRLTGGCYFWQMSFFDGDNNGVYYRPDVVDTVAPNFSHHKITCFEYANGADLDLYYQKISKAYATIPDSSGSIAQDQLQARVEENRIVGPISDEFRVSQIIRNGQTATAFTVDIQDNPVNHGFSVGVAVNISGVTGPTEADSNLYNGSFLVTSAQGNQFTYQMSSEPSGNAIGSNVLVKVEIDTVDSASPYVFNCSLRSVWGINGMHADGALATGFKSMVVAQFTGISLQKDDRAFVLYNPSTGNYEAQAAGSGAHINGLCKYRKGWRHRHIFASNDAFIQVVSVFAVGFGDHFFSKSGGDLSITNSNSNFGNTSLRSTGFKSASFTKDKAGQITHIIPPKDISDVAEISINWVTLDINKIRAAADPTKLFLYGYTNQNAKPPSKIQGYTVGARRDSPTLPDKVNVLLIASGANAPTTHTAKIDPSGPTVTGTSPGDDESPLKYDTNQSNWYLQVDSANNDIYTTLIANSQYQNLGFTPTTFIRRVPDARDLKDRIYRFRYVLDKDAFPIPREPITGFVVQPRSSETNSPAYDKTYYIYEVEVYQPFERGTKDGIYYLTILNASVAPSTSNFDDFAFSQYAVDVYPTFDRDNPVADPAPAVSVADNDVLGKVTTTDGASPTPNEDTKLSISKETAQFFLLEQENNLGYNTTSNTLNSVVVTGRLGDEEERKIALKLNVDNSVAPILCELRRYSILRASGHTFEYLGFGPGNYSTAFPSTQVEVLSSEQVRLSQSLKESAGVAYYSGVNSDGELYVGNQVINPITGQITNEDIAQLNVVGEEGTTIQTFSEVVLTDKLTVIGGASNQLESVFSGPVTFQKRITAQENIQTIKLTYANDDGTVLKQTFLAEDDGTGQPDIDSTLAFNDGDIIYNIDWSYGKSLGWVYQTGIWYEWGLTDTGPISAQRFSGVTHYGIGMAPDASNRMKISGNTFIDGDLDVTGKYGAADKYSLATGIVNGNNGVVYNGNGSTTSFAISPGHNHYSVLVFLNGVCQIPGVDYTCSGNAVDFSVGTIPANGSVIHIRELVI
tara:strand:- start:17996 stop:21571 length:3576 start_codon:yes stop_codon:yes gene_type:complete